MKTNTTSFTGIIRGAMIELDEATGLPDGSPVRVTVGPANLDTEADMNERQPRRTTRELTAAEQVRLQQLRDQIAAELPEMTARDQLRKEARAEATPSGDLRRTIHSSPLSLSAIARQARIDPIMLDEFLTGERTLRSDVMDRLAAILGYDLTPARAGA